MQTNMPRQSGRDLYLRWVEQNSERRWPKFATLDEACWSGPAFELHTALAAAWPLTPDDDGDVKAAEDAHAEALGWLAGVTCFAMKQPRILATDRVAPGLLEAWAKRAPNRRDGRQIDINESRFLRWLKATDWSAFYAETMTALQVVRGAVIDAGSLYDMARMRADSIIQHSDAFSRSAAFTFYEAQQLHHD
ncbi:hypothetical protein V4C85_22315 [Ralstonia solanacearum]|uniref:hypothetical protein n=1 Tax=Ralstonia solanacearum TaxID=305 RepID=UPI000827CDB9|nr:hypothetical protein [Ralstonia solanacearum]OCQ70891.1 hypothetical protein AR465_19340 [Ralstonia solanacearum]